MTKFDFSNYIHIFVIVRNVIKNEIYIHALLLFKNFCFFFITGVKTPKTRFVFKKTEFFKIKISNLFKKYPSFCSFYIFRFGILLFTIVKIFDYFNLFKQYKNIVTWNSEKSILILNWILSVILWLSRCEFLYSFKKKSKHFCNT